MHLRVLAAISEFQLELKGEPLIKLLTRCEEDIGLNILKMKIYIYPFVFHLGYFSIVI